MCRRFGALRYSKCATCGACARQACQNCYQVGAGIYASPPPGPASTCQDDPSYVDAKHNWGCTAWVGYSCDLATYYQIDVLKLKEHCPKACGACAPVAAPEAASSVCQDDASYIEKAWGCTAWTPATCSNAHHWEVDATKLEEHCPKACGTC